MAEVERLEAHVEVTGVRQANRELDSVDRHSQKTFGSMSRNVITANNSLGLLQRSLRFIAWPMIISGAGVAASGLSALAGAATGAVAALAPLAGLTATIPGGLFAMGQGAGAVALAFKGVGEALKAYSGLDDQAAATAARVAKATKREARERVRAAKAVQEAQEALARAQERVGESQEEAAERVAAAQERLEDAYKRERKAIENLNKAREKARERLIKLREAVERYALSEARAKVSIVQAQEALRKAMFDPLSSYGERLDAQQDLAEAEQRLVDITNEHRKAQEDLSQEMRQGVEGNDAVVDALEAVTEAQKGVQTAIKGINQAQQDAADVQKAAADSVVDAQDRLTQALERVADAAEDTGDTGTAAMRKFRSAMEALTPVGRQLVDQLRSMSPLVTTLRNTAQNALFPGVIQSLQIVTPMFGTFNTIIAETGTVFGEMLVKLSRQIAAPAFLTDISTIATNNLGLLRSLGDAFGHLLQGFVHLAVAAAPLTKWFGELIVKLNEMFSQWAQNARGSEQFAQFMQRVMDYTEQTIRIFGNLWATFKNIFAAIRPFTEWLWTGFEKATQNMREFTGSAEGMAKIGAFFESMKEPLSALGGFLKAFGGVWVDVSMESSGALTTILNDLTTEFLPVLKEVLSMSQEAFGKAFVDALVELTKLFGVLVESGVLTSFVQALAGIMGIVNDMIVRFPFLQGVLGQLTTVAGALVAVKLLVFASGLGRVADAGLRVAGAMGKILEKSGVVPFLANKFPGAANAMINPLGRLKTGLANVATGLANMSKKLVIGIADTAKWAAAQVAHAAKAIAAWVMMGIQALIQGAKVALFWVLGLGPIAWVIAAVIAAVVLIIRYWDDIVAAAAWVWKAIRDNFGRVIQFFRELPGRIWEFFVNAHEWLQNVGRRIMRGLYNGIVGYYSRIWEVIQGIPRGIWDIVRNAHEWLTTTGQNIVIGLWNGLVGMGRWLWDRVWNWIRDVIPGPILQALGISSPSKLMANYGEQVARGLALGVESNVGLVASAAKTLTDVFADTMPTDMTANMNLNGRANMTGGPIRGGMSTPRTLAPLPTGGGGGISSGDIAALLEALENMRNVHIEQTFMEKQDPTAISAGIAWEMR